MGWNNGYSYAGRQPPAARVMVRKAGHANTGTGHRTYGYSGLSVHDPVDGKDYLIHYGISGQKWGERRFQNEDGTLTEEGKKRYRDSGKSEEDGWKKSDAKTLSDEELNRRNSRLQREQNYENLMTSSKERERKQFSADFKKKVLTAALVTPIVAIVGVASKKYWGGAATKVGGFIGKYAKSALRKLKTGNLLRQAASRGQGKYARPFTEGVRQYMPRANETPRSYDFVKREPPLWRRKVIT